MVRAGQTEGSVDLARMAGRRPAGVICEIMDDDGSMARMPALKKFALKHGIGICSIADLIEYRMREESLVRKVAESTIPTATAGTFRCQIYESEMDDFLYIAMVKGEIDSSQPTLVRVHSECLTGDIFGSLRCDCQIQLQQAMAMVAEEGSGVILYLRQEGRGIGLVNKIRAYALQEQGFDTVQANEELGFQSDLRNYGIGAQILKDLGIRKIRLLTNNPKKIIGLEGYGLEIIDQLPIEIEPNRYNYRYLSCKKDKMGHLLRLRSVR